VGYFRGQPKVGFGMPLFLACDRTSAKEVRREISELHVRRMGCRR
jgi:hypothetical protein